MHSKPLLPSLQLGRREQNRPKTLLPSVKPGRREQFGRVTDAVWQGGDAVSDGQCMCVQHGKAGVDHGVEYSVGLSGECPDVPIEAVTFENISTYHKKYG